MRGSNRGRIGMTVASAVLVAAASAVAACGNAAWSSPPRYDGAGYAVLARALLEGEGYRAIDHPDRPRHAHFPPGYPALLAATWRMTGVSTTAAHVASVICTVGAVLSAWCWFRRMLPPNAALMLGLALLGQLALGADRRRDPVRAAVPVARPVDDPRRGAGRPPDRRRGAAGRLPSDAPRRRRPGDGRPDRPGPATSLARGPDRRRDRRDARLSLADLDGDSVGRTDPGRPRPPGERHLARAHRRAARVLRPAHPRPDHRPVRRGRHHVPAQCQDRDGRQCLGGGRDGRHRGRVDSRPPSAATAAGRAGAARHAPRAAGLAVHRGRPVPGPADPVHPGRRGRGAGRRIPPSAIVPRAG